MNERIKQLAEQADIYINESSNLAESGNGTEIVGWHIEKFAELLVHECCSIVENLSPGYNDYRNQIEDAFRRAAISEMKYILLGEKNE